MSTEYQDYCNTNYTIEDAREAQEAEAHGPEFGPEFFDRCPDCWGEGELGTGRYSWTVDSGAIDPPWEIMEKCQTCNGSGYVRMVVER